MSTSKRPSLESRESSSPMITRAVALALRGEYSDGYTFPAWQKLALTGLGALPQSFGRFVISRQQSMGGLPSAQVDNLEIDDLIKNRLADYHGLEKKFKAVTLGVGMGGATAHLAAALQGPFLPQAFVVTLKGGSKDGNVYTYLHRSKELAFRVAKNNPGILTIQHYDPVHDGWLTRWVNHLRLKLLELPAAYIRFIRENLEPGGEVVYLAGGASWLRYRLGERSVFQVGGWGDISAEEYLEGSDRINQTCRAEGLTELNWKLAEYPLERGPESEWGSEPGLGEALEDFCTKEGYQFTRISFDHPNEFSALAYFAVQEQLKKTGKEPAGVFVETFSQFDTTAVLRSGLLPLWLIFNTQDSQRYLRKMAANFPAGKPIFFSPLSTFSMTPDMVSWEEWNEAFGGREWVNVGARLSHYPSDAQALVSWSKPLRRWCVEHPNPVQERISAEELSFLAADLKKRFHQPMDFDVSTRS